MKEMWKPFAGGNYAVSNRGRVKRLTAGRRTYPGRMMALTIQKNGYYCVRPVIDGKNVHFNVHVLVAVAFVGECPEGLEVNHKDGVKTNNVATNLEYVTHARNLQHAREIGLTVNTITIPKETIEEVRRLRTTGLSYSKIVAATGVSLGHCWRVVNGTRRVTENNKPRKGA
jgi:hypothetical protein